MKQPLVGIRVVGLSYVHSGADEISNVLRLAVDSSLVRLGSGIFVGSGPMYGGARYASVQWRL